MLPRNINFFSPLPRKKKNCTDGWRSCFQESTAQMTAVVVKFQKALNDEDSNIDPFRNNTDNVMLKHR